jgi:chlorobactene glucosyltransferase
LSAALILSGLWLALVAWLIVRALAQRDALKPVAPVGAPTARGAADPARIAVIVPARDEGHNIGPCVDSLLAQRYPADRLRIVVVDDDSSDDTAEIVRAKADGAHLALVTTPPLPAGWKGKPHACSIGVGAAGEPQWLCFIDADMRADPELLASAVAAAEADGLDLLSLAPRHVLGSFAERLILPCGLYLLAFSQDLERVQSPQSREAVATGQFILVRREVYAASGGFGAVRGDICEDVAFATLVKRSGYRVLLKDGSAILSTRMYTGWSTLWPGIAKNLQQMLGGTRRTLVTALVAFGLAWASVLIPLLDIAAVWQGAPHARVALAMALAGSASAFGMHLAGARHFRIPLRYGLIFPVGYTVGAMIALDSVRWHLTGRVRWKGRVYS